VKEVENEEKNVYRIMPTNFDINLDFDGYTDLSKLS